jgi:hypothetical protein
MEASGAFVPGAWLSHRRRLHRLASSAEAQAWAPMHVQYARFLQGARSDEDKP